MRQDLDLISTWGELRVRSQVRKMVSVARPRRRHQGQCPTEGSHSSAFQGRAVPGYQRGESDWFPSGFWNSGQALSSCQTAAEDMGASPNQVTLVLKIWKRMTAVYPVAAYGGHPRNYPVYGPLIVMDSISRSSQVGEGGRVRRTSSLLFVDKIVDH